MAKPHSKRVVLSIDQKVKILDKIKEGATYSSVQSEYGVVRRTIEKWKKAEAEIRADALKTDGSRKTLSP